ncbi:MAG: beta-lactamase family protein [Kordiimonadaceae bacterium]|nr:beta-lactamase family protein [Kordiimonadaceae bacterium]MBT6031656.1 beta-lactamase family protein [Kordiimonadaceae bacterium]
MLCSTHAQVIEPSRSALAQMDAKIKSYMADNNIPGGLIAVASKGEILHLQTYGEANVELSVPVKAETLFEIGSISKQFAATAALQLVEEGKLSLNDKIHKYIPSLPSDWAGVTIHQLLTHTSGIPDYEEIYSYDVYRLRMTPEEVIKIAQARPVDFAPGQGYYYSNTAYFILSMIVERIDGLPLGQILKKRIFDPLGMRNTRMADPEAIIKNRAEGYWVNKLGELINRNATETSSTLGAGGLLSSAADLAKWDAALYGTKILSEQSKKTMWTSVILPDGTDTEYALGWRVSPERGLKTTSHSGQVAGFVAYFARYVDTDTSIIVFMNRYRVSSSFVKNMVMDTFMPTLKP